MGLLTATWMLIDVTHSQADNLTNGAFKFGKLALGWNCYPVFLV